MIFIQTHRLLRTSALALLTVAASMAPGSAATISFASGDGLNEGNFNRTLTPFAPLTPGTNVLITPNPAWEQNHATGGKWVSFAQTDGSYIPPDQSIKTPYFLHATANFIETFILDPFGGPVVSALLSVWADDTAAVYLNQNLLISPAATQDGACASGIIACEPGEGLVNFDISAYVKPGLNILTVSAFQRAGGPFGVLYDGKVSTEMPGEDAAVPEPASMGLLGGGLSFLVYLSRRRRKE